jgi:glycerophosphoryl diester phosphodiesterase
MVTDLLPIKEIAFKKDFFIAAHRGSSGTAPENTLAAYRDAINAGADIVEADVQMSADGKAVVFHDKFLSRTTDGKGKISDLDYDNFKNADAGSWFDQRFKNEHIPLISDVIDTINNHCYLNIEVKNIEGDNLGGNIERIIEIIIAKGYRDYTAFSSFYYNTLYQLKRKYPEFPTVAIRIPKDTRLPSQILKETGSDAFIAAIEEFTPDVSADIRQNNIFSAVYTVNTKEEFDYAMTLPVRTLVTNFPARIKEYLDEYRKNKTL